MGRIHYEIPDDIHRRAKMAAAAKDQTLRDFVIAALTDAADRQLEQTP